MMVPNLFEIPPDLYERFQRGQAPHCSYSLMEGPWQLSPLDDGGCVATLKTYFGEVTIRPFEQKREVQIDPRFKKRLNRELHLPSRIIKKVLKIVAENQPCHAEFDRIRLDIYPVGSAILTRPVLRFGQGSARLLQQIVILKDTKWDIDAGLPRHLSRGLFGAKHIHQWVLEKEGFLY